jgi:uncharacterized repeat protein (TIGR02543 family)
MKKEKLAMRNAKEQRTKSSSNEQRTMNNEQRENDSKRACLTLFFVLCSLFIGCDNPFAPPQPENIPAGKGSFSLSVAVARTILPTLDQNAFASYTLAFTATNGGTSLSEDRSPENINAPVYLEPGTYTLVVTAFLAENKLVARGSIDGLEINEGESTSQEIILRAIADEDKGTFTYDVTFPAGLATAGITIAQRNNSISLHEESFLSGGGGTTTTYTETVSLDTGYYNVVFTFEKAGGQTLIWRELLHIYSNLESVFGKTFEDGDFYKTIHTITFVYNNGTPPDSNSSVFHGGKASKPTQDPIKDGYTFDGWYSNEGCTGPQYNFDSFVVSDITLYAKWKVIIEGMVWIRAGTFTMGSPTSEPGHYDNETQHEVTLTQGFYMGKYQVTQAQYQAVMGNNPSDPDNKIPVPPETSTENRPVERVSWYRTLVFCNRLSMDEGLEPAYRINGSTDPSAWGDVPVGDREAPWDAVQIVAGSTGYRLPTEAQWEYACRAGTVAAFNWGADYINDTQANYNASIIDANNLSVGTRLGRTTGVGSYAPNAWGLYDMHGNVLELCWDWYGSYSGGAQTDPTGAVSGDARVRRGGTANGTGRGLRSAYRTNDFPPWGVNLSTGFRIVRP